MVNWNLPAGTELPTGRIYPLADGNSYAGWLLVVNWSLPAGKDLPARRIYQLADGNSYAGWLVV